MKIAPLPKLASESFDHLGQNLAITMRALKDLIPHKTNPRTHSEKQIRQIARSIGAFGFTNPVLVDGGNGILAGHGRVEGAKLLGLTQVPVIELSHLSEVQRRAYIIADNKLAENAGWNRDLLALELDYLRDLDMEFDLTITGFEVPEIDVIRERDSSAAQKEDEDVPVLIPEGPLVSKPGDLWRLGRHTLFCGSALDPVSYARVLGDRKAQMVCTDPPYNVAINGHVGGKGSIQHEEFVMASGEMSSSEFTAFLKRAIDNMILYSVDGSIHDIFMDWRHMRELLEAANGYTEFKNLCVWNKTNGGMGSLYRSKHELAFIFKNGTAPHINNVELGKHGRYRTNVWDYAGINTFREDRMDELQMHPTVKPVAMIKDAILDCSDRHGIILDPFGGSGTALIAAEMAERTACLIELEPRYVDCTIERFQKLTEEPAIHVETGKTFTELKTERKSDV